MKYITAGIFISLNFTILRNNPCPYLTDPSTKVERIKRYNNHWTNCCIFILKSSNHTRYFINVECLASTQNISFNSYEKLIDNAK